MDQQTFRERLRHISFTEIDKKLEELRQLIIYNLEHEVYKITISDHFQESHLHLLRGEMNELGINSAFANAKPDQK